MTSIPESVDNDTGSTTNPLKGTVFKNPSVFYWRQLFYMFVNDLTKPNKNSNETENIVRLFTKENPTNASTNWTLSITDRLISTTKDLLNA